MSKATPFLLLFRNTGADTHAHLSASEREAMTQRWNSWFQTLSAQGKVAQANPLAVDGRVVSGVAGERVVDGPYAEGKEVVGGYFILTVADIDEATAIAKQCPGLPIGLVVEVRPIADCSPQLTGVRGSLGREA